MLTGINFSPPLYFLFNFCLQLIYPTSIEDLRIQSLVFIIIGIVLSFLLARKIFGTRTAFLATVLVSSQSNLLFSHAQEARHYAMFFACGAWVLFMQFLDDDNQKKSKFFTFLAHFCFCQIHYFGIIFSGLVGLSYLISDKKRLLIKKIPFPIFIAWIISFPTYLFFLNQQSSHLGNWPKPNELSDLLASYNDSILFLTIFIPALAFTISSNSKRDTETLPNEEIDCPRPIIITSFLWILVPLLFWIISQTTPLNLFVDRYFIPKEAALIFLVGFGLSFIFQKLHQQKSESIHLLSTFGLSLVLILISTKRAAFGFNKDTNYHHSLIIEETYPESEQPIMFESDPGYFPNAYLNRNECLMLIEDKDLINMYGKFSKKINFTGI
jgi:uncharacterized membrane protein